MAKAANGPLGSLNGKINNLVFYMLKGQHICRTIGDPGKPSINQLANRQEMSVTMQLVSSIRGFISVSFDLEAQGTVKNAHNLATSYIKKKALKGQYPNLSVDYSKVELSHGTLAGATDLKLEKTDKGIQISWDTEEGRYDDIVMILFYHPLKRTATSRINAGRREEGTCLIELDHDGFLDEPIEAYICFRAADGKKISDSAYLGNLNGTVETEEEISQKKKYAEVKQRFSVVAADYLGQIQGNRGNPVDSKAFRTLEKEYQVLKNKLDHLPGKPG